MLVYYQTNRADAGSLDNWAFTNLSQDHVGAQSLHVPAFDPSAELVAYVTSWGGMNLAGLNPDGEIEVVWWAPGITRWQSDNLSLEAGAAALGGRLVSYVAPWGAMHLAATSAQGDLIATWWSPESNRWAFNNLTSEYGGPRFSGDSLTAYVTDWGGLNIAGVDAVTHETSVYWWTPISNGWRAETLVIRDLQHPPQLIGRLESVALSNNLNIFGRSASGELLRIYWYPSQGAEWIIEPVVA